MAVLQAALSLLSRSIGKIFNALFGWAVRALFGQPSPKEQPFLLGIVAAAAAWPVLLLGIAVPKVAAMVLAFVPFHNRAPAWVVRVVWVGLAVLVPIVLGLVIAARAPGPREPVVKRILRGWPITIGLASAFLVMFVTVPGLKVVTWARRRRQEQLPLVMHTASYHRVAQLLTAALNRHGFALQPAQAGWWLTVPTRILRVLGGDAFRQYTPDRLEYHRDGALELALYPNGVLLRGPQHQVERAHGLSAEVLAEAEALQTGDAAAQQVEERIHAVWAQFNRDPVGQVDAPELRRAIDGIARDLCKADVPYEDWQILYRELLQLDREARGEPQLLAGGRTLHQLDDARRALRARASGETATPPVDRSA
jgi:hypothetical protein